MKKLLALLLALLMIAMCAACSKDTEKTGDGSGGSKPESVSGIRICTEFVCQGETISAPLVEYEVLPDQSARIVRWNDLFSEVIIPESVDGIPVSTIGKDAFLDYGMPFSFRCVIPDSVTVIEENAFASVSHAASFELSDTHPTLKLVDNVLISPAEKRIIRGRPNNRDYRIPDGIETIDDHAFKGCIFSSIDIPASVTKLGRNPFAFCNSSRDAPSFLREVTVSPDNPSLELRDGMLISKTDHRLVWCFEAKIFEPIEYEIPSDIEIIDDFAFQRWPRLDSLTIPASVKQVGANPFYGLSTEIIHLAGNQDALTLTEGMLISNADHRLVALTAAPSENRIPDGVQTIGDYALTYNYTETFESLCSVIIPDSVTRIGNYAFRGLKASVRIPVGIRYIGNSAFYGSTSIGDLVLEGGVEIGQYAFGESGIQSLEISGGALIHSSAFNSCFSLKKVRIGEGPSRVLRGAFARCRSLEQAEFGEGLSMLGSGIFTSCDELKNVSLPASLSYISGDGLKNHEEMKYNEKYDMMETTYSSTVHASVSAGSPAEQYCKENSIDYSVR